MKTFLSISIAASLVLFVPQIAKACQSKTPFSPQDIAFADVIFEGRITKIAAKPRYVELTFTVHDVVRGELPENEVVIGWRDQYYDGTRELSAEEMRYTFGETTRVAISRPKLANLFCEPKLVKGKYLDEETGAYVEDESLQPVCETGISSLVSVARENIPFVLSNKRLCGSTYLYPVETYENMRDYNENVLALEKAMDDGIKFEPERVEEMIGPGPLSWKGHATRAEFLAAHLFREQKGYFSPALKTNLTWQNILLDLGESRVRTRSANQIAWFDREETLRLQFRETLRMEILKLLDYSERDPNFRERFLLED